MDKIYFEIHPESNQYAGLTVRKTFDNSAGRELEVTFTQDPTGEGDLILAMEEIIEGRRISDWYRFDANGECLSHTFSRYDLSANPIVEGQTDLSNNLDIVRSHRDIFEHAADFMRNYHEPVFVAFGERIQKISSLLE